MVADYRGNGWLRPGLAAVATLNFGKAALCTRTHRAGWAQSGVDVQTIRPCLGYR